jgi:hypothetical protein
MKAKGKLGRTIERFAHVPAKHVYSATFAGQIRDIFLFEI